MTICVALTIPLCACAATGNKSDISLDIDDIIGYSVSASGDNTGANVGDTSVSSTEENTNAVLAVENINEIPVKFVDRFVTLTSFKSVTEGQTTAPLTDQSIYSEVIKSGDKAYFYTKSESTWVSTAMTAYFNNGKVNYNYNDGGYKVATLAGYVGEFGVYPVGKSIEGFKISAETVLSVERVEVEDNYRFKVKLDAEKSTDAVKVQMKKFGNLEDYPKFSSVTLTLTVNGNFDPISVEVSAEYKVKMIFEVTCKQNYTVTYESVNGAVTIPEEQNFDALK